MKRDNVLLILLVQDTRGEATSEGVRSRAASKAYRTNYDSIFAKKDARPN